MRMNEAEALKHLGEFPSRHRQNERKHKGMIRTAQYVRVERYEREYSESEDLARFEDGKLMCVAPGESRVDGGSVELSVMANSRDAYIFSIPAASLIAAIQAAAGMEAE